jgi:hypothetical protein
VAAPILGGFVGRVAKLEVVRGGAFPESGYGAFVGRGRELERTDERRVVRETREPGTSWTRQIILRYKPTGALDRIEKELLTEQRGRHGGFRRSCCYIYGKLI